MFYIRGEVLSDQFDHFKLILFWVPECFLWGKNVESGNFFPLERGGHPFPLFLTMKPPKK